MPSSFGSIKSRIAAIFREQNSRHTILGAIHGESWPLPQRGCDIFGKPEFVFNEQHAHVTIIHPAR
jgi:hypothetical protein